MTTEEMLEEIEERGVVKIEMTERGVEFLNENNEVLFIIPFAGKEG